MRRRRSVCCSLSGARAVSTPDLHATIRPESPGDRQGIFRVHERAFGRPEEAVLVDDLRAGGNLFLSLAAFQEEEIVGHIAFSPVVIEGTETEGEKKEGKETVPALALAPVGVLPQHQGKGIGAALVRAGLEECERRGCASVIVLGAPAYYGRFGFVPARPFGIAHPFGPAVPDEAFMLRFAGGAFPENLRGVVRYAPAFDRL